MMLRRELLIAMADSTKIKTGTVTMSQDELLISVNMGLNWNDVYAVILHLENISSLNDIPANTQIDLITILDPAYRLTNYASVHPYYTTGFAKNSSNTLVSTLSSRSTYSTGPNYNDNGIFFFRVNAAGMFFKEGYTYRWTAILK